MDKVTLNFYQFPLAKPLEFSAEKQFETENARREKCRTA